jgi:peptidoglycan/LPS O-acetylase OafA/YrhL
MKHKTLDFDILDGLRGIASIYVVINHCRGGLLIGGNDLIKLSPISEWSFFTKIYYALLQFTTLGGEFVVLFFVLSGYSIAYSLRNNSKIIGSFYKKRFIRLYPPLILALFWAFFVFWIISIFMPELNNGSLSVFDSWKSTFLNFIYLSNGAYIPQFWSFVHEVIFYILAPFLFLRKNYYYVFSLIFYLTGWILKWNGLIEQTILSKYIFEYNFYFAIGVFLFNNYHIISEKIFHKKIIVLIISLLMMSLMVAIKFIIVDSNRITFLISSLFSVYLIVNFQANNIKNKLLLFIGTMSYTLYISHFASMKFYNLILIKSGIVKIGEKISIPYLWIIGVIFCLIFSYFFYLMSEKHSKAILNKLRK